MNERTIREIVALYLDDAKSEICPAAHQEKARILNLFVEAHQDRQLSDYSPLDLKTWIRSHVAWLSGWTKARVNSTIQRCFNWAVAMRLIRFNPFRGVPRCRGEFRQAMKDDELQTILRNSAPEFRRLVVFIAKVGCRTCEAYGLKWEHIDWQQCIAVLPIHKTVKKSGKPRILVLVPCIMRLLDWIRRRVADSPYVFINKWGLPWKNSAVSQRLGAIRRKQSLPLSCTLYCLRHRYGSNGVRAGLNLKTLAELMGHSRVSTTETYVHISGDVAHLLQAVQKINGNGHANGAHKVEPRKRLRALVGNEKGVSG
jgi:integrase/recombinase XerD